jgi:hypothetical protein
MFGKQRNCRIKERRAPQQHGHNAPGVHNASEHSAPKLQHRRQMRPC